MNKYTTLVSFLFLIIAVVIAGIIFYHQSDTIQVASTFVLTPTPSLSPTIAPEPVVTNWTTYNNDKYNFAIDYPADWEKQEYTPESGGLLVAFSPNNNLPCNTCTYVHDGFFSIKMYNQKTDAQAYTDFTTRMKNIGQSKDYISVHLDSKAGVLFANTVAVENNGWVYEVSLDTNAGNAKVVDSKLFQKAATSLHFTNLIFTN